MNIKEVRQKTTPLFKKYGVTRASVFGSVARGEAKVGSDIDILIELKQPLGLFKFARLNYQLEDVLQKKVDLVKKTSLKPAFAKSVLKDLVNIYGR